VREQVLVRVEGVSKKFCRSLGKSLRYGVQDIVSELLAQSRSEIRLRPDEFWALRDVSFELHRGECLGIIGRNGAGKSTLLKLLSGLMKPDRGRITVRGRMRALIELGAGFSPVLTGRENIYVNAAVLGLTKRQTTRILNEIIDFAEIEEFIDTPVQNYSSGMRVRLGFAVAASLNPDILLVDEVLAVGDIAFQRKCLRRMKDFVERGGSLVVVSHNMDLIRSVCTRGLYLDQGQVRALGDIRSAIKQYVDDINLQSAGLTGAQDGSSASLTANTPVVLKAVEFSSPSMMEPNVVQFGETVTVRFIFEASENVKDVNFGLSLWTKEGLRIASVGSRFSRKTYELCAGTGAVTCILPKFPLLAGNYGFKAAIYDGKTNWLYSGIGYDGNLPTLTVTMGVSDAGVLMIPHFGLVSLDAKWSAAAEVAMR